MHNESCRYRSTIANLSPSPVTDEEKRWHQFYMRAVVTQQRHPPVNQHNYNTRPVPDYAFDKQWATKVLDQTKAWLNNNPLNDSEDNETHRHDPARR
ncbi:hypothetical protein CDV31_015797 [Fusarium ambrosium]|uniref:Uncharacterized protein n=1 Tax=Fusarium ambrosium TaxID=131363 RepID=A0A428SJ68_9HYPO|nr:hypothetical protein CDV31_015797 [Fusarium ambrosium]